MAQIPIVSGIYTDSGPDVRTAYPVNMQPVPKGSGVSESYLRPVDGVVKFGGTTVGVDRGGINWRNVCYRVMGTKLVSVASNGAVTVLGDVGAGGYVTMDYSFDRLAIASGGRLYYWDGTTLAQVTDPDLLTVVDMCWVDGYFMTTDGEFLVVTDLTNPFNVNPLKYGSNEADPDPIVALVKLRNEVYALNRNTIEVFDNVGGDLFPFQRVDGAQVQKGCVGTHACCNFDETIAFLGSGRNESPSIYMAANATATPIATQDIDLLLQTYTEAQLAQVKLEARLDRSHKLLYVHLPDRTIVYDHAASEALQQRVWFTLVGGTGEVGQYPARNLVWCYDKWLVGSTALLQDVDTLITEAGDALETEAGHYTIGATSDEYGGIGYLDRFSSAQWGQKARWEFSIPIVYNESRGAIFQEMELVSLTGRVHPIVVTTIGPEIPQPGATNPFDPTLVLNFVAQQYQVVQPDVPVYSTQTFLSYPQITTSYSLDGVTWSQDQAISIGTTGDRLKRLVWWRQGFMRDRRIQRFRGDSDAHLSVLRLEARLEPLSV